MLKELLIIFDKFYIFPQFILHFFRDFLIFITFHEYIFPYQYLKVFSYYN